MKYFKIMGKILSYQDFRIFEKESTQVQKSAQTESENNVGRKIVKFLNKYGYKYQPGEDSKFFVSFKTGNYPTIVPPKDLGLGGGHYSSPNGLYCFDMNYFKQRLFGDDEISIENFDHQNLTKKSDLIKSLCLGFENEHSVSADKKWKEGIPRWLWIVKMKDNSTILSSKSEDNKVLKPLIELISNYSHYFLKTSNFNEFDPQNKKNIGINDLEKFKTFFEQNGDKYKPEFLKGMDSKKVDSSMRNEMPGLFKGNCAGIFNTPTDEVEFYYFIKLCSEIIGGKDVFSLFTEICEAIGVDGFTQRGESHLHIRPKNQTVLLSDNTVEEVLKIDLKEELKDVDLGEMSVSSAQIEEFKKESEKFLSQFEKGDVIYSKKHFRFFRIFTWNGKNAVSGGNRPIPSKTFKVNLDESEGWKFIKELKSGDKISIVGLDTDDLVEEYNNANSKIEIKIDSINLENGHEIEAEITKHGPIIGGGDGDVENLKRKINLENDLDLMKIIYDFKNEYITRVLFVNKNLIEGKSTDNDNYIKGKMELSLYRGGSDEPIKVIRSPWEKIRD